MNRWIVPLVAAFCMALGLVACHVPGGAAVSVEPVNEASSVEAVAVESGDLIDAPAGDLVGVLETTHQVGEAVEPIIGPLTGGWLGVGVGVLGATLAALKHRQASNEKIRRRGVQSELADVRDQVRYMSRGQPLAS
jgi:hypothetical protein